MLRSIIAVGAVLLAGCVPPEAPPTQTPESILRDFGYTVRVPASALHGPGSLVLKRNAPGVGSGKVMLGDICSPGSMTFPATIARSSAESIGFGRSQTFEFGLANFQALGLGLSAASVEQLSLRFGNTEVLEYSLEDLGQIREALGPNCTGFLERQIELNNAFQVVGVFKADLAYAIVFKADASADARLAAQRELGARFGVDFASEQSSVGTGLYYGLFLCDAADCALSQGPPGEAG